MNNDKNYYSQTNSNKYDNKSLFVSVFLILVIVVIVIVYFSFSTPSGKYVTYVFTFMENQSLKIESKSLTCSGKQNECKIVMPNIVPKDGYEVVGWSEDSEATTASYLPGNTYSVNGNKTLYAITKLKPTSTPIPTSTPTPTPTPIAEKKTYAFTFHKNTALSISSNNLSCTTTASSCTITMPTIVALSGYEVVGWSEDAKATTATYLSGNTYSVNGNKTLYAITKLKPTSTPIPTSTPTPTPTPIVEKKTYTFTFYKNTASSISINSLSCTTTASSCTITMPAIVALSGYEVVGWSEDAKATTAAYLPGHTYSISQNKTLYAITKQKNSPFLEGTELVNFKRDNNINQSTNFVVEKTIENVNGIFFTTYYVYNQTQYNSSSLSNFKTYAKHCLQYLARVDTHVLRKVANSGTKLVFLGSYDCDNGMINVGYYTFAAYCNSINRNVIIGYQADRLNWDYYEKAIVHEFGHALDFTILNSITGKIQTGISGLSQNDINSNQFSHLFTQNGDGTYYSWRDLGNLEASNLKNNMGNQFSAYSIEDLKARPHEYFADIFNSYYISSSMNYSLSTYAPLSYQTMQKVIRSIQ